MRDTAKVGDARQRWKSSSGCVTRSFLSDGTLGDCAAASERSLLHGWLCVCQSASGAYDYNAFKAQYSL